MNQLSIDLRARSTDPETSKEAARRAATFAESHAGRILAALKLHGPMTAHELHIIGLTVVQIDRRLPELARLGLARVCKLDDGADMTRGGFRVWQAVPEDLPAILKRKAA